MERSEQINELLTALNKFQKDQKAVSKDSTNPFLKNKYASLDSIIENTRENLVNNGMSFSQFVTDQGVNTYLFHSSGQYISSGFFKIKSQQAKGLSEAQSEGVAITYTKRYQLGAILGVSTDGDTDGQYGDNKELKDSKKTDDKPSKEWLNPGTDKWKDAVDYIVNGGGDIAKIKSKYLISKANEAKLTDEAHKSI